jgi:hypothetical protein
MKFLPQFGRCKRSSRDSDLDSSCKEIGVFGSVEEEDVEQSSATQDAPFTAACAESCSAQDSNLLKTVGWVSAALGAVAIGVIVGREIRQRYKFNRRTPYDLYAHSGDELRDVDCGVGI